ncbi:VOC family protein [Arsenicicoccus sp. oral taxon 190]|uniref:VOC family protein n=1 Tax=Arsenicicoccus sp. oral taxon 190 TaxID=1658671 RepID=UPI00067A374B|nr:VOC family protein [Arsenicicoccus sp. oral taxon 190]AKT52015.1 glyoxalase [Arsenicicoccus sp. oral taxon 190]
MNLRLYTVVVDCHDIAAQARWWAEVLDWRIVYEDDQEVALIGRDHSDAEVDAQAWASAPPGLVFVPVAEGRTVKNRVHLDLAPHLEDDRDAQIERLLAMGATRVDVGQSDDATWTVLADPEGNEFCVLSSRNR